MKTENRTIKPTNPFNNINEKKPKSIYEADYLT